MMAGVRISLLSDVTHGAILRPFLGAAAHIMILDSETGGWIDHAHGQFWSGAPDQHSDDGSGWGSGRHGDRRLRKLHGGGDEHEEEGAEEESTNICPETDMQEYNKDLLYGPYIKFSSVFPRAGQYTLIVQSAVKDERSLVTFSFEISAVTDTD